MKIIKNQENKDKLILILSWVGILAFTIWFWSSVIAWFI